MKLLSSLVLACVLTFASVATPAPAFAQKAAAAKPTSKTTSKKSSAPESSPKEAPKSKAKASTSKAASPCKGLSQTMCTANRSCGWIKPKKSVSSDGRKLTAYCRKVAAKK
jgi:hypothetical protein